MLIKIFLKNKFKKFLSPKKKERKKERKGKKEGKKI
jgi:hypothetical protein